MVNAAPEGLCACTLVREGTHGFLGWVSKQVFDILYGRVVQCGRRLLTGPLQCRDVEELPLEIRRGMEELDIIDHSACEDVMYI